MKLLKLFCLLLFFTAMNLSCSKPVNDCLGPKGNHVSEIKIDQGKNSKQSSLESKFKEALFSVEINHDLDLRNDSILVSIQDPY